MVFCQKCGAPMENNRFCPQCGAPAAQQQTASPNDFSAKFSAINSTADTTTQFDPADIQQNKAMAILAYLSWLVLIPLFAAKESKFARFHTNQGLVLAITEIAWWVATGILSAILYAISWSLGSIISTLLGLVNLVFLVILIIGIANAANGKAKELPIIGKFRILK